jgi:23S rRNA pseudouridine2605 synthase
MRLGMGKHPRAMGHAARFRVGRAIVNPPNPRGGQGGGTHRTGLQRDVKVIAHQPFRPRLGTGRTQGDDLGVRSRVIPFPCAISGRGHNVTLRRDDDGTHGHLAAVCGGAGLGKCLIHMGFECHTINCPRMGAFASDRNGLKPQSMSKTPTSETPKGDRIAKVLARAGVASRRDSERLIQAGLVTVNGKTITSPALNVTDNDKITVEGKPIKAPEPARLWLYHKPTGLVTTDRDEKGRATIYDELPEDMPRVMSVGRLDLNSEGLLLLTNDGGVKRKLELPSTGWVRKYRVRVNGRPKEEDFAPLRKGLVIDGERFQPMTVSLDRQQGANAWLTVAIREGKNREIRRAMEEIGLSVNRLLRVSYGPFQLGQLKAGEVEEIRRRVLRDQLGLDAEGNPQDEDTKAPARPQRRRGPAGKPGVSDPSKSLRRPGKPAGKSGPKPTGKPGPRAGGPKGKPPAKKRRD